MRKPWLPEINTMAYGFKAQDFLAFILFPRTYREIMRQERIIKKQKETIDRFATMLEGLGANLND